MRSSNMSVFLDFNRLAYIVVSLLLVTPIGFGVPAFIGGKIYFGYGLILLLLLLGPSVWATGFVAGTFGEHSDAPGCHLAAGCVTPIIGFVLLTLGFGVLDAMCEQASVGCSLTAVWTMAGLIWVVIVFGWVWGLSGLVMQNQRGQTNGPPQ
jgi:hypothetical protein